MSIQTHTMSVTAPAKTNGCRQFCIDTLNFLDTSITEFTKTKNWRTDSTVAFPIGNANALAENLIPQWVADNYTWSTAYQICGYLEFSIGGTKYCFFTYINDYSSGADYGYLMVFIKTVKEFKNKQVCSFSTVNSTSVLYPNENLIVFIAQKSAEYFIIKFIKDINYIPTVNCYGTIYLDKPTNTADTNCYITFGDTLESTYNIPFQAEDINIPVSMVAENLITESEGFIVNNFDNTIPLYRVFVGDNTNGIRGEIGYLKTAPFNYKTGFSVINNVAGQTYMGVEDLGGVITNANANVLFKI